MRAVIGHLKAIAQVSFFIAVSWIWLPSFHNKLRRTRKIKEGLRVELDEIEDILWNEVVKREVVENEATTESISVVKKANRKIAKKSVRHQRAEDEIDGSLNSQSELGQNQI